MTGQLSDQEFIDQYPNAQMYHRNGSRFAITTYGKYTVNYWIQYPDASWTNYNCHSS